MKVAVVVLYYNIRLNFLLRIRDPVGGRSSELCGARRADNAHARISMQVCLKARVRGRSGTCPPRTDTSGAAAAVITPRPPDLVVAVPTPASCLSATSVSRCRRDKGHALRMRVPTCKVDLCVCVQVSAEQVKDVFAEFGPVAYCQIVTDQKTKRPKGSAPLLVPPPLILLPTKISPLYCQTLTHTSLTYICAYNSTT